MPGILNHHVKKSANPSSFHRDLAAPNGVTALGEHGLVPIAHQKLPPPVESPRTVKVPTTPSNQVLSELRTLRQLSAGVFDPQATHDFLAEIILFGVIGLLCAAWPIISMLATMAGRH